MPSPTDRDHAGELLHSRGVLVPFTTPQFTGARLRLGRSGQFELLLRNPAGGKGIYLFDPAVAHRFSAITLHDRILLAELVKQMRPTPRAVRTCARRVALTGAAGHENRMAAMAAVERERERIARLRDHFLRAFGSGGPEAASDPSATEAAEAIAERAESIGLPTAGIRGRHEIALTMLEDFVAGIEKWLTDAGGTTASAAARAHELACSTCEQVERDLARRQHDLEDARTLRRRWDEDRAELLEELEHSDWLLDGWPTVCALWSAVPPTDHTAQIAALSRIERLLPASLDVDETTERCENAFGAFLRAAREGSDWRQELRLAEILERQEALRPEF